MMNVPCKAWAIEMNPDRVSLQPAYILHQRPYRDSSVIVEILSAEYGRLGLLAKGARRERSRMHGLLQPFSSLILSWQGKGELKTLTDVEPARKIASLSGRCLMSGFYINELLMRLLPRYDAHPELFGHYEQTLQALVISQNAEIALRRFECAMLDELGYGLNFYTEVTGEEIDVTAVYRYEIERGPVRITKGSDTQRETGIIISGRTLLELGQGCLQEASLLREAKLMMRAILAHYIGDKPLQTAQASFHKVL